MPKVTFVAHDGHPHVVDAKEGDSLMRAATDHGVPGIDGDCGGLCACATCHVYVEAPWADKVGSKEQMERDMLEFTNVLQPSSRLACQIKVTTALDGLVVSMPEGQH